MIVLLFEHINKCNAHMCCIDSIPPIVYPARLFFFFEVSNFERGHASVAARAHPKAHSIGREILSLFPFYATRFFLNMTLCFVFVFVLQVR